MLELCDKCGERGRRRGEEEEKEEEDEEEEWAEPQK